MALLDDLSRMGRDDLRATLRGLGEWLDREHGSNVMEDKEGTADERLRPE